MLSAAGSRLLVLVAATLVVAGCAGTDVGNPDTGDLELQFTATQEPADGALVVAGGTRITQVWMSVSGVSLRPSTDCTGNGDIEFESRHIVELVSGLETPAISLGDVETTDYCRMSITLSPADQSQMLPFAPPTLDGASVVVVGQRADGAAFEIALDFDTVLRLRGDRDEPVRLGGDSLLAAFDIEQWLVDGVLERLDELDTTELFIAPNSQPPLQSQLESHIRKSVRIHKDDNADGILQPTEALILLADPLEVP